MTPAMPRWSDYLRPPQNIIPDLGRHVESRCQCKHHKISPPLRLHSRNGPTRDTLETGGRCSASNYPEVSAPHEPTGEKNPKQRKISRDDRLFHLIAEQKAGV